MSALALATSRQASAAHGKLVDARTANEGTWLALDLAHAPFPYPGTPYDDSTTMVFVPKHFKPAGGSLDVLVHFHGHNSVVKEALAAHAIADQVVDSKQNIILVAPQLAVRAADGSPGKLSERGGLARMLTEVAGVFATSAVRKALGPKRTPKHASLGTIAISAHSGGYRSAASCLRLGGIDVSEVYLFDALYGEIESFHDWVRARKSAAPNRRHKLVSHFVTDAVRASNRALEDALIASGVPCLHETKPGTLTRAELTRAHAAFIDGTLSHNGVTHELNALRDCLYASRFNRTLASDWFDDKNAPRAIEPRDAHGHDTTITRR